MKVKHNTISMRICCEGFEEVVQALHVPSVAIGEATASLVKKLKLKTF